MSVVEAAERQCGALGLEILSGQVAWTRLRLQEETAGSEAESSRLLALARAGAEARGQELWRLRFAARELVLGQNPDSAPWSEAQAAFEREEAAADLAWLLLERVRLREGAGRPDRARELLIEAEPRILGWASCGRSCGMGRCAGRWTPVLRARRTPPARRIACGAWPPAWTSPSAGAG